ncbi:uncharacterized protein LOC111392270 [Olea europaea var. sylvestris]|uniref:uncharacterized protein LOC111392270 n=1 Tax=Olea europaea var. sylvestris TaxID=158386 RepID=UPI000C1D5A73|nr:uncharacterized protein LOC111392270 [Olea europaea var. sylvestris]
MVYRTITQARTLRELRRGIDELKQALAAQAAPPAPPIPPAPPVPLAYPHIPSIPTVEQFRRYRPLPLMARKTLCQLKSGCVLLRKSFGTSLVQKTKRILKTGTGREISEYESKFGKLSRYAPHLVSAELMKAKRYKRGLRPEIRQIVSSHDLTTFQVVVKKAQIITYSGVKLVNQGECLYGKYACYKCGQPGHGVFSFPSIKKPEQEKKGKARVFALTHNEAVQNSNIITGILSIFGTPIYVLIDSGTTHSFISNACLAKINASCKKNDNVLEVSMPSGGTIDTDRIATGVQINFDGLTLEVDLSGEEEFRFYGSKVKALPRIISALKAKSMLRKPDCQGYLVSLIGTSSQDKILDDVSIIREYADVFPDDLLGIPPNRQVAR